MPDTETVREEAVLNATGGEYAALMEDAERKYGDVLRPEKPAQVLTDKKRIKIVPCTGEGCGRPLVVNTFYAAKIARCSECRGGDEEGTIRAPEPGRTDPAMVESLSSVLVNPAFAKALCPVHPEDEEHEMELKSVAHSPYYGPNELVGYRNGIPEFRQLAIGETVMHQCLRCRATVSYSTTAQTQFRRQNEARKLSPDNRGVNGMADLNGSREEAA